MLRADDEAGAWTTTLELVDLYGPSSAWALARIGDEEHTARVQAGLRARVFDLATAANERVTQAAGDTTLADLLDKAEA